MRLTRDRPEKYGREPHARSRRHERARRIPSAHLTGCALTRRSVRGHCIEVCSPRRFRVMCRIDGDGAGISVHRELLAAVPQAHCGCTVPGGALALQTRLGKIASVLACPFTLIAAQNGRRVTVPPQVSPLSIGEQIAARAACVMALPGRDGPPPWSVGARCVIVMPPQKRNLTLTCPNLTV